MCQVWSASLQKGMNLHLRPDRSVVLMSRRPNAPYRDRVEDNGRVLIYEGHDMRRSDEDIRAGRVVSHEEVKRQLRRKQKSKK